MNITRNLKPTDLNRPNRNKVVYTQLGLLILVPLLSFFVVRWVGYDIPNLSRSWQPSHVGSTNAAAFVGAPSEIGIGLNGAFIRNKEGRIFQVIGASQMKAVTAVPEEHQEYMQTMRQTWRPLIPFSLVPPPGEVVDSFRGSAIYGSLLDRGPMYHVILADGTIWAWTPTKADYIVVGLHLIGLAYGIMTLTIVSVLLRLERLWPDTRFWRSTITDNWDLWKRTGLTALAAPTPGALLIGLFSLPFLEKVVLYLIGMVLLTTLLTVLAVFLLRKKEIVILIPVLVATGVVLRDEVRRLIIYDSSFDWALLFALLIVGFSTAYIINTLITFFRLTSVVSATRESVSNPQ